MGSADPPWKIDEKIKSENMQKKKSFLNILRAIRAGRCTERRYTDHIFIQISYRLLQNAPFCSQIFNIFFASGAKGVLTPLARSPPAQR